MLRQCRKSAYLGPTLVDQDIPRPQTVSRLRRGGFRMIWVALAVALPDFFLPPIVTIYPGPVPRGTAASDYCRMVQLGERQVKFPMRTTNWSETTAIKASCKTKTVRISHRVDRQRGSAAWWQQEQNSLNDDICNGGVYSEMARAGWSFIVDVSLKTGQPRTLKAHCTSKAR